MNAYRVITAKLRARTAIHIGSGQGAEASDDLIRRDTQGAPIIPGTAIAGALRALLTRLAPRLSDGKPCDALLDKPPEPPQPCGCAVCRLLGDITPTEDDTSLACASRLLVFDAPLFSADQAQPKRMGGSIRDGVGIDRASGAAARAGAVKFDMEVLPAGTEFELRMELRDADGADEQLLAAGLSEWEHKRMWLGGRVARGLGAFDLIDLRLAEFNLDTPTELMMFLKSDSPWVEANDVTSRLCDRVSEARARITLPASNGLPSVARRWAQATFVLQATGTFLTNDAVASAVSGFDHAPLLAANETWGKPVLTGAGLRGVLRSQAERIARTLVTREARHATDWARLCPACDPNAKGKTTQREPLESCDTLLLYQANKPGDKDVAQDELCLACQLFGSTRWGSRLIVEDAPLAGIPQYKMMDFLAIDRFTGGGSEGLKFDALALWRPRFKVRLFFDNPAEWELGWLALVLRDLRAGRVPVGFGAAKGFGNVTIAPEDWSLRIGFLTESDFPAGDKDQGAGFAKRQEYDGVYHYAECSSTVEADHPEWLNLVENWVAQFRTQVETYRRDDDMRMTQDSYFGQSELERLYPKEVKLQ